MYREERKRSKMNAIPKEDPGTDYKDRFNEQIGYTDDEISNVYHSAEIRSPTSIVNILTCIGSLLLFLYSLFVYIRRNRGQKNIPGPTSVPLLGSAFRINPRFAHLHFDDLAKAYGKIFEVSFFNKKAIVLNDIDMIEKAFIRDSQYFSDRPEFVLTKILETGVGIANGNPDREYRIAKKLFIKSLHVYGSGTQKFEEIVSGEIRRLLKEIDDYDGEEFEVSRTVKRSVCNVMSVLLIGKELTDSDFTYTDKYLDGLQYFVFPTRQLLLEMFPFLKYLPFYRRRIQELRGLTRKVLDPYLTEYKDSSSTSKGNGIVYEIKKLQQKDKEFAKLSDETIGAMIAGDILTAGIVATSIVIPSVILFLIHHPEYQLKVQEEIDTVIGHDREPTIRDRQSCVLLEAIVLETLRIVVPAPFSLPHVCNQDREFEGYRIKADTQVLANYWYVHHDESIWGDPWNFRPERFIGEDGKIVPHNHKFRKNLIPFGVGLRRCPGMNLATSRIFLYLAYVFQRYTFEPVPGKVGSCDPRSDDFEIKTLLSAKPFYCRARKRQEIY